MFGRTPPLAIVTFPNKRFNSSSFLIASVIWRGTENDFGEKHTHQIEDHGTYRYGSSYYRAQRFQRVPRFRRKDTPELLQDIQELLLPFVWRTFLDGGIDRYDRPGTGDQPLLKKWSTSCHHVLLCLQHSDSSKYRCHKHQVSNRTFAFAAHVFCRFGWLCLLSILCVRGRSRWSMMLCSRAPSLIADVARSYQIP